MDDDTTNEHLPPLSSTPDFGDTYNSDIRFKFPVEDITTHQTADGDHIAGLGFSHKNINHDKYDDDLITAECQFDDVLSENSVTTKISLENYPIIDGLGPDDVFGNKNDDNSANNIDDNCESYASSMCFDVDEDLIKDYLENEGKIENGDSAHPSGSCDEISDYFLVEPQKRPGATSMDMCVESETETNNFPLASRSKCEDMDVVELLSNAVDTLSDALLVDEVDAKFVKQQKEPEFYTEFSEFNEEYRDDDQSEANQIQSNQIPDFGFPNKSSSHEDMFTDIDEASEANPSHLHPDNESKGFNHDEISKVDNHQLVTQTSNIHEVVDAPATFVDSLEKRVPDATKPNVTSKNANNNIELSFMPAKSDHASITKLTNPITPVYKPRPSPYHRAFTPLSATPTSYSPAFKTPIQAVGKSHGASGTPSTSKFVTPNSQVYNPFEAGMLDRLHLPMFSPSVFTKMSTPSSSSPKEFCWSIENAAILNPADIDESSYQSPFTLLKDKQTEMRVQRAIRQYFSNNVIAPSPCQAPQPHRLPPTPAHESHPHEMASTQKVYPVTSTQPKIGHDVHCQTTLTIPMNVDVTEILSEYMTYRGEEDQEVLSTSTLRRKLFFQGDTSCGASPASVRQTPESGKGRSRSFGSVAKSSPASDHFSSSPIALMRSPTHPRTSTDHGGFISPDLSPVKPISVIEDYKNSNLGSFLTSPGLIGHRSGSNPQTSLPQCTPDNSPGNQQRIPFMSDMSPISQNQQHLKFNGDMSPILQKRQFNGEISPISQNHPPFSADMSPITQDNRVSFSADLSPINSQQNNDNSPRFENRPNFTSDLSPIHSQNQKFPSDISLLTTSSAITNPNYHAPVTNSTNSKINLNSSNAPTYQHQSQLVFPTDISPIHSDQSQPPKNPAMSPISVNTSQFAPMSPIAYNPTHPDSITPKIQPMSESRSASPDFTTKKSTPPMTTGSDVNHSPPLLPLSDYLDFSPSGVSTPDKRKERSRVTSSSTSSVGTLPHTSLPRLNDYNTSVFLTDQPSSPRPQNPRTGLHDVTTFDLSLSVDASEHEYGQSSNQVSHDTGYQTSSLQSTNIHHTSSLQTTQDSGQHSNLTTHFTGLPFKSFMDTDATENHDPKTPKITNFDSQNRSSGDHGVKICDVNTDNIMKKCQNDYIHPGQVEYPQKIMMCEGKNETRFQIPPPITDHQIINCGSCNNQENRFIPRIHSDFNPNINYKAVEKDFISYSNNDIHRASTNNEIKRDAPLKLSPYGDFTMKRFIDSKRPIIDEMTVNYDQPPQIIPKSKSFCDSQSLYKNMSQQQLNFPTEKIFGFEQYRRSQNPSLAEMNQFFSEEDNQVISQARLVLKKVERKDLDSSLGMTMNLSNLPDLSSRMNLPDLPSRPPTDLSYQHTELSFPPTELSFPPTELSFQQWPPVTPQMVDESSSTASMMAAVALQKASQDLAMLHSVIPPS